MVKHIWHIIQKEVSLEWRQRFNLFSSLLYVLGITFVVYKIFGSFEGPTKTILFWVLLLFGAVNLTATSFDYQSQKRKLVYYQLYHPVEILLAKLIFNFIKILIAAVLLILMQSFLSNSFLLGPMLFFKSLVLSVIGITAVLTIVSAISSYSQNQNALAAILGLPLLIPILLLGIRVSLVSERMFVDPAVNKYLMSLFGIDILLIGLSIIFVPIIWKA